MWSWADVPLEACTAEELVEFPHDCLFTHGREVLKTRFNIDVEENPHVVTEACLVLLGFSLAYRLLSFARVYVRYVWDDNPRAMARGLLPAACLPALTSNAVDAVPSTSLSSKKQKYVVGPS